MMQFTKGNVLEADVEALVNTVNTVGVMGKGIALMFKEAYPENFKEYEAAFKRGDLEIGSVFVHELPPKLTGGPRWILNFPTKKHWRNKSRVEWVEAGLQDLRRVIEELGIRSIAIPPLGCGHGGLRWADVRRLIQSTLADLDDVAIHIYEPTSKYQNVAKRRGVKALTDARALVVELVRRYLLLGVECSLLEVQKLTFFLDREIRANGLGDPLKLRFVARRYGPYADSLRHLLDALDGSFLHCGKRISDAKRFDAIWVDDSKHADVAGYLESKASAYLPAIDDTYTLIDGFESPHGMELLSTVAWLLDEEGCEPTVASARDGLERWPENAGQRKQRLFDDRMLGLAIDRLTAAD
jgi:O-acetyl-ADP-ribose deacetylase (regulator of RNase III)